MQNTRRFWSVSSCLLVLLSALGTSCSKTQSNPVQGKVLYKGEPLKAALVSFHPDGTAEVNVDPSIGLTNDDGTFSLTTGQSPGAPAGKYVVTIICFVPLKTKVQGMSMGGEPETYDRLQGAYADRAASRIKVEVKSGPNQLEPFQLK